tara:strand:+ start:1145 stop:1888 length:744 start_codon:yes stop_codon:yes gene_type:complete
MNEMNFPTEIVDLPSKGILYSPDNPLSSGKIEMKYMTAKEEDILTNQNYIQTGVVLDKLLQSLIVSKINYNDLLIGDKNAIMIAARVLGYGKDYSFSYKGSTQTVDLALLDNKELDESLFTQGKNEFSWITPSTNVNLTFKLLTHGDENKIQRELEGLKKIDKHSSKELSTRLKYMITSVNEDRESKTIREFVDNYFLAKDSRAFREHIKQFQPDVNLTVYLEDENGSEEVADLPIGISFFWPDASI